jgi:DNA-binding transcriptional ArsR family regulator
MNQDLQPAFRALGDPTRREILRQLSNGELTITEVVDRFDLTRTAVRKHLTILEEGNLISVTARGKERVSKLNPTGIKSTADWFNYFDQFWDTALDSLKHTIEKDNHKNQKRKR